MASIPVLSVVPQNLQVPTLLPPTFPAVQIKHNENPAGVGGALKAAVWKITLFFKKIPLIK